MTEKEPLFRTSTKAGAGMTIGMGVMILGNEFFPEIIGGLSGDAKFVLGMFITAGVGFVVSRYSKTPKNPGKM